VYALLSGIVLSSHMGWGSLPWTSMYAVGYFYIAGLNLMQHFPKDERGLAKSFAA
jgi:hypothetical protein